MVHILTVTAQKLFVVIAQTPYPFYTHGKAYLSNNDHSMQLKWATDYCLTQDRSQVRLLQVLCAHFFLHLPSLLWEIIFYTPSPQPPCQVTVNTIDHLNKFVQTKPAHGSILWEAHIHICKRDCASQSSSDVSVILRLFCMQSCMMTHFFCMRAYTVQQQTLL